MRELDIGEAEMVTFLYLNVHNIVVLRDNIASETALEEVDLVDLVLLLVYVLILVALRHFKKWTDPTDKPAILASEKSNVEGKVFVYLPR